MDFACEMIQSAKGRRYRLEGRSCESGEILFRGPWRKVRSVAREAAIVELAQLLALAVLLQVPAGG